MLRLADAATLRTGRRRVVEVPARGLEVLAPVLPGLAPADRAAALPASAGAAAALAQHLADRRTLDDRRCDRGVGLGLLDPGLRSLDRRLDRAGPGGRRQRRGRRQRGPRRLERAVRLVLRGHERLRARDRLV